MTKRVISSVFNSTYLVFVFSGLSALAGSTINGIVISRFLGSDAIAAFGFAGPYVYFVEALSVGIAAGVQVVCGRYIGQGKQEEANQVLSSAMLITTVITAAVWFIFFVFPAQLANLLGATAEAASIQINTIKYLQGCVIGFPAVIGMTVLCPLMQMDGDKGRAMAAIVVMTVVSILGNIYVPLFYYPLEKNTVYSMLFLGLSSSIGYYFALAVLLLHFLQKRRIFRFDKKALKIKNLFAVLSNGIPYMLNRGCSVVRGILVNWAVFTFAGPAGMVAFSVTDAFTEIPGRSSKAYGQTTLSLGGIVMGEEKTKSMENLLKISLFRSMLAAVGIAFSLTILAKFITRIYLPETEEAFPDIVVGIRLYGYSMIPFVFCQIMCNYYNCIGRLKLANSVNFLDGLLFVIGTVLAFVPLVGETGVWWGFFVGRTLTALFIVGYTWFANKRVSFRIKDFLLLPKDFDCGEENRLEKIIKTCIDVEEISVAAQTFCKNHNIDSKRAYYTALCIEEMGNNIVDHGFTKDNKKHYLAVNMSVRNDDISIRFQDDCKQFDPKERLEKIYHNEDITKNIGILLVTKIAKKVDYVNTLKLNNLIIKI